MSSGWLRGNAGATGCFPNPLPVEKPNLKWMHPANWGDHPAVVVCDGLVFGVPIEDEVCALSLTDGTVQWRTPVPRVWFTPHGLRRVMNNYAPAITDEIVVFGTSDGQLRGVSRQDGAPIWTSPAHVMGLHQPVVLGEIVIVKDNNKSGAVLALDLQTGSPKWRVDLPKSDYFEFQQPLLYENTVIVVGPDGLIWLDVRTGERVHEVAVGKLRWVVREDDTLYGLLESHSPTVVITSAKCEPDQNYRNLKVADHQGEGRPIPNPPAVLAMGQLHGTNEDYGMRFSIDLVSGECVTHENNAYGFGPLTAANDQIYAVQNAELNAYDVAAGTLLWTLHPEPPVLFAPYALTVPFEDGLLLVTGSFLQCYGW